MVEPPITQLDSTSFRSCERTNTRVAQAFIESCYTHMYPSLVVTLTHIQYHHHNPTRVHTSFPNTRLITTIQRNACNSRRAAAGERTSSKREDVVDPADPEAARRVAADDVIRHNRCDISVSAIKYRCTMSTEPYRRQT